MDDFTGQAVIITGGTGNLGQAVTRAFHAAGARVAIVGRKYQDVVNIFGDDVAEGERALYVTGDLTDESSVTDIARQTADKFGRIDILVNTAGGIRAGTALHETPVDVWDFMMSLNARTVFLMSRAVIPYMVERGHGRIISTSARAALKGTTKHGPYNASKMAVIRLTETMAAELRHNGITANCVLPGTIDTPGNRAEMPDADFTRWVTPESLAGVILFLASEAAADINGAAIPIYGRS
ncbi:MAG: SDR family oxidoreductase [Candidatus Promineofilum sp.]|nr:SDR family oxidoreductase [Promineifilum sp.]